MLTIPLLTSCVHVKLRTLVTDFMDEASLTHLSLPFLRTAIFNRGAFAGPVTGGSSSSRTFSIALGVFFSQTTHLEELAIHALDPSCGVSFPEECKNLFPRLRSLDISCLCDMERTLFPMLAHSYSTLQVLSVIFVPLFMTHLAAGRVPRRLKSLEWYNHPCVTAPSLYSPAYWSLFEAILTQNPGLQFRLPRSNLRPTPGGLEIVAQQQERNKDERAFLKLLMDRQMRFSTSWRNPVGSDTAMRSWKDDDIYEKLFC